MRFPLKTIYLLFFLSGAAGLVYEIVWGRLLVLVFGSTTNSFVAVISAFLGGLAIGSLIFGKFVDSFSTKKLIKIYSLLEIGVGLTAISTLVLIPTLKNFYTLFSDGSEVTLSLLMIKFFLSIVILLAPTILMGATLPTLVALIKNQFKDIGKAVSVLYALNTFGATLGVLTAAYIMIELFGLRNTVLIAAAVNILIGIVANFINIKEQRMKSKKTILNRINLSLTAKTKIIILFFSISGLISIAYEILWSRILTPTLGTFVYAFASVLALYLVGIAIGSYAYPNFAKFAKSKYLAFAICELGIGAFAILSVLLTHKFVVDNVFRVATFVLPSTIFMGLTFPVIISLIDPTKTAGRVVGISYFGNTIGSIIGGFIASFLLIPTFGSSPSVIILSLLNFTVAFIFINQEKKYIFFKNLFLTSTFLLIVAGSYLLIFKKDRLYEKITDWRILDAKFNSYEYSFKEDEVASTLAYKNPKANDQRLIIDGVATTSKVAETKIMAHLPIALHPNPQDVLVIAFGMGSTYRSSLSYGIRTDAVELVPSVPKLISFFHENGNSVLTDPNGKVIINDGRNYAFLTNKKYDIVIIDPPPPFNASGTTVLHSKEFYEDLSKILNPNGIVAQWIYYWSAQQDDIEMALKSFIEVFPYVEVFRTERGVGGLFVQGSHSPIQYSEEKLTKHKSIPRADADIKEINSETDLSKLIEHVSDKQTLARELQNVPVLNDAHPRTEYFFLRHKFSKSPALVGQAAQDFLNKISFK